MESPTSPFSPPSVVVTFNCLPLRRVSRLDVPLDASDAERQRAERMKEAIAVFGHERSYYLYDAYCLFRFANSEVDGVCRFEFEGAVETDAGDRKCERTMLQVRLVSETCGGVPAETEAWLAERVRQAVVIEFDRYILASQSARPTDVPAGESSDDQAPGGMGV